MTAVASMGTTVELELSKLSWFVVLFALLVAVPVAVAGIGYQLVDPSFKGALCHLVLCCLLSKHRLECSIASNSRVCCGRSRCIVAWQAE